MSCAGTISVRAIAPVTICGHCCPGVLAGEAVVDLVVDATKHGLVVAHAQPVELFTKVTFGQKLIHGCLP
jgi:hypothetical protein